MSEDLFQYLWKMKLFDSRNLFTTDGDQIEIIHVGTHNMQSGPDFFNAKIKIADTIWAGNIELHLKSSDWMLHKHQLDKSYENIILHVVYKDDKPLFDSSGNAIKTLVLEQHIKSEIINAYKDFKENNEIIPCSKSIQKVPHEIIQTTLERLLVKRLEHKSQHVERLLLENNNNWEQSFYMQLAANFGFKINQVPFELLARNTPLSVLAKHKSNLSQIEALLFGQAGMLNESFKDLYPVMLQNEYAYLKKKYNLTGIDSHLWKFSKMRPVNFASIRIAQFAALVHQSSHLFSKVTEATSPQQLIQLFKVKASTYWDTHYTFYKETANLKKHIGKAGIENLIINTIVPFMFVYGKHYGDEAKCELSLQLLSLIKPEKNNITRLWQNIGIDAKNAAQSQSLIELKTNYCELKRCLQCSIGHFVLKNN